MIALLVAALVYGCVLSLLNLGFSLICDVLEIPNFGHSAYLGFGMMISLLFSKALGVSPYLGLPAAALLGGALALAAYWSSIRPLVKRGARTIILSIVTLAHQITLIGALGVLSWWMWRQLTGRLTFLIRSWRIWDSRIYALQSTTYDVGFHLGSEDFRILGVKAVLPISLLLTLSSTFLIAWMMRRRRLGVILRAVAENPELLTIMGLNPYRIQGLIWLLSGALAAMAGALYPLFFCSYPTRTPLWMMSSLFAAGLLTRLISPAISTLSGFVIAFTEIMVTWLLQGLVGIWIGEYRTLIPLLIVIAIIHLKPKERWKL